MAKITRLRARPSQSQIEAIQGTLNLGGWSEAARLEFNERLTALHERGDPDWSWRFVMAASKRALVTDFLGAVVHGPRGKATLAVWMALHPFIKADDGLVLCTQATLAKTSHIAPGDVSRALRRLVEIGALQATGDGHYRVHPTLLWHGRLAQREQAEAAAPVLSLV